MTETEMGTLGNEGPISKSKGGNSNHDKMQIRSNNNSHIDMSPQN